MEQITATSKTFGEFLGSDVRNYKFVIPAYQRRYSWDKSTICDLWEDITLGKKGYYIGNILLNSDNNVEYVVDGQQRLTTLYLIMLALYTHYKKLNKSFNDESFRVEASKQMEDIAKLLGLKYDKRRKEIKQNLKLNLLSKDANLLQICIDYAQSDDYINNITIRQKNTKLVKGYIYLLDTINELLNGIVDEEQKLDKINDIYDKVENLILLPIYLKELSDVFSVFSSINSKGQSLTIMDLLKADYLKVAERQRKNTSNQALKKWEIFEDALTMENSSIKVKDGKKFLQSNYDAFFNCNKSSITVNESLKKYQSIFNQSDNIDELMDLFIKRANIYALMTSKNYSKVKYFRESKINDEYMCNILEENEIVKNLQILQSLETSSAYPLVMYLLEQLSMDEIKQSDCNEILKYLITIFVRRNIIQKPKASNLRNILLSVLRNIQNQTIFNVQYIINLINKEMNSFISDKEFINALQAPIYSNQNIKTVGVILRAIERYGIKNNQSTYFDKKTRPENLDSSNWTIEHIFPQDKKLSNGWDTMLTDHELKEIQEKQFDDFEDTINKLGNLTLTGYNSELSNHSFEDKKNQINDAGINIGLSPNLYLNQSIYIEQSFENKKTWTYQDINNRNENMINDVIKIFKL